MANRIILTADDYGANDFIDMAILQAVSDEIINSIAVFVTFPDSEARIKKLVTLLEEKGLRQKVGIGLHFSVTAGWATKKVNSTLTYVNSADYLFRDAYNYPFRHINLNDLATELQWQIDLLAGWLGGNSKSIDHISNHHGVTYIDTRLFTAYADVAQANKIPIRSPLNWSMSGLSYKDFDPFIPSFPLARQGVKLRWMEKIADALPNKIGHRMDYAAKKGIRFPFCVNDTFYGQPFMENLDYLLLQLNGGEIFADNNCVEMMFHLGHFENSPYEIPPVYPETDGIDLAYYSNRKLELNCIRKYNWQTAISALGLTKITYRQL